MQHGYAPEGGKRITAALCRVAKGVNGIVILLPILGECWLRIIPKALPWADLFLAFQAVFTPTVYTPLPLVGVGGGSPVLLSDMKGGSIMFFCPSVRYKRGYHVLLSDME